MTTEVNEIAGRMSQLGRWFWAGEAEIARRFFDQAVDPADHIRWLQHQCYRELHGPGFLKREASKISWLTHQVAEGMPAAEEQGSRLKFERDLFALAEEFNHFRLFADILEGITGTAVLMMDISASEFPEAKKLELLREMLRSTEPLVTDIAYSYAEGGGAGIFYAGSKLSGSNLLDAIASACGRVYEDEVPHGEHGAHMATQHLDSQADWSRAMEILIEVCQQRLRMRYEMFGLEIDEARITAITNGNIEPIS